MDINQFMEQSLAKQDRIIALLEAMAEAGLRQTVIQSHTCGKTVAAGQTLKVETTQSTTKTVGNVSKTDTTKKVETVEAQKTDDAVKEAAKQAVEQAPAEEKAEAPKDLPADLPAEVEAVKASIDDARTALKQYAQREGNEAAMDLLKELGAVSVTALSEQGPEALGKLVAAVKEALK